MEPKLSPPPPQLTREGATGTSKGIQTLYETARSIKKEGTHAPPPPPPLYLKGASHEKQRGEPDQLRTAVQSKGEGNPR